MVTFLTVVYVAVCLFLILVVLLQAGRGGGMGAAMGGSSQTVFGGAGAGNFLQRLTVVSAALFMILSAVLAYLSSSGEQALDKAAERVRMREEARTVEPATGNAGAAVTAAIDAGLSTAAPATDEGTVEEAPADVEPLEQVEPDENPGLGVPSTAEGLEAPTGDAPAE